FSLYSHPFLKRLFLRSKNKGKNRLNPLVNFSPYSHPFLKRLFLRSKNKGKNRLNPLVVKLWSKRFQLRKPVRHTPRADVTVTTGIRMSYRQGWVALVEAHKTQASKDKISTVDGNQPTT
ncbi:hypothetical protein V8G54_025687, partial [Vigna mungo]